MSEVPIKGRARLLVDHSIIEQAPVKIETPKFGQISWNLMEVQGLFDLFKSFLLLPDQYEIIGVYFDTTRALWSLLIESACIPIPERNVEFPFLSPVYRIENNKISIQELKVSVFPLVRGI